MSGARDAAGRARAGAARRVTAVVGSVRLALDRDLLHQRARRRSASSSRSTSSSATPACSRSATSASSRSAPGRRACSPCRSRRSRRRCPTCSGSSRDTTIGQRPVARARRARRAGVFALVAGLPLMRLSGPRGRHRHVRGARDHEQHPALLREDRPRAATSSRRCPETTDLLQAAIGASSRSSSRSPTRRSRCGRRLRAARDDAAGGPRGRDLRLPAAPDRVRALRGARGSRRRPLRPLPADQRGLRLPRADVHHARDARDRRHDEPVGRGRRGARRVGARLRCSPRRRTGLGRVDLPSGSRLVVVGFADGARADRATDRDHRRPRGHAVTPRPRSRPETEGGRG